MPEALYQLTNGAPAAALILLVILLVSIAGLSGQPRIIQQNLFRPYFISRRRNYYTWISSGFIHGSYAHLIFNALTLWSFGFPLERAMGTPRFVALYLIGLVASDIGTYLKQRQNPQYASLGASGAILAVLFASIIYFPTQSIYFMIIPIPIPAWLFAIGYLAYTLYASHHARDQINHDAHLGGAITGLLFVGLTDPQAVSDAWRLLSWTRSISGNWSVS
jgi:membrane associated rhomboid family serine protease